MRSPCSRPWDIQSPIRRWLRSNMIGPYDLVIGERDRAGQQNAARWLGNSALNRLGSYLVGIPMRDLTSGFRAMRRHVMLDILHLLPNQYSWPTTSALAFAKAGFHVRFEPVVVRRRETGKSSQKLARNGIRFLLIILRVAIIDGSQQIADDELYLSISGFEKLP